MDVAVVIRAAGERTLSLCKALVEKQVSPDRVYVVQAAPFEAALRECYQKGIDAGAKWTLTLDADVLVRSGAIVDLIARGTNSGKTVFLLQGKIHDKLLLCSRDGGLRLYRTALLHEVLNYVPQAGTAVRPESQTVKGMERAGWHLEKLNSVFGIHDYEQYYRDIHRKAMLHAHKHLHLTSSIVPMWKHLSGEDPDYHVAIKGYCEGLQSDQPPLLDSRAFDSMAGTLGEIGLTEKAPLTGSDQVSVSYERVVEKIIYERYGSLHHSERLVSRFREIAQDRGLRYSLVHSMAWLTLFSARKLHEFGTWMGRERA